MRRETIAPAADGSVWITLESGKLEHYSSSLQLLASVTLPSGTQSGGGLVVANNGSVWWTDRGHNAIGEYANNSTHVFAIPTANSGVAGITRGGDGALWFTESTASKIGRIDASGSINEYSTPTPNADPVGISGPNGGGCNPDVIWFVEAAVHNIGKITLN